MSPASTRSCISSRCDRLVSHLSQIHVFADDLAAKVDEHLIDVGSSTSRGLVVRGISPYLRDLECPSPGDDTVFFEVGLVSYDDERNVLVIFDVNDLLPQLGELLQAAHAGDGEDKQKALALLHV
jgi:hypothetical protein